MDTNTIIIGLATYLITSAWSWFVGRFTDKQKNELAQLEAYVPIVAHAAAAAFPSLGYSDIPSASAAALTELRTIIDRVGLHPSDQQWAHLETLINGVLYNLYTHDLAHAKLAAPPAAA